MAISYGTLTIEWLGYATVRIESEERTIYLDPGRYGVLTGEWEPATERAQGHPSPTDYRPEDGDVVCITHVHHYDPDGIDRVLDAAGTVVACEGINRRESSRDLPRFADLDVAVRKLGIEDERLVAETPIWTVPAYNEPDGPHTRADGTPYHAEGRGCGFLLAVDGTRIFFPGDTDVLAGHEALDVDVLLPPIGGTFTMDRREAADLAQSMEPDLVVPVHYNTFEAIEADSQAFADDLESREIPVAIDE